MILNYIWFGFFIIAFVIALVHLIFFQDSSVFDAILQSTFDNAKVGFELSLGLTGVMTLWLGVMRIGEKGGMVEILAKLINPLFRRLFPEIPANHPVNGSILLNIAANMLGLDNAATPLGLKAMNQLQELNPEKEKASNAMIMFLVINTSGLTIIPVSIMVYRAQLGAANPADVFLPILLSTFVSTLAGIISVSLVQRINLVQKTVLLYLLGFTAIVGGLVWYLSIVDQQTMNKISTAISSVILFSIIIIFMVIATVKKVRVYDEFIEGAKEGFHIAVRIIPYLVGMLVAIGVFRASGAMDSLVDGISWCAQKAGLDTSFVPALPTAIMKPLSGSGARGMMLEAMKYFGADSFVGRLSCLFQGSTDTTFYIIALYFGSVGIRNSRYAVVCGLIADLAGIITAIFMAYLFFG
ncbi:MAG TPA: nucleoside recognition domain-containing protein [Bacteroidales bacterium]|jgi:spore maturation protein SpmA|nr:spore maturation protein [Bacteroidales bacterium]MDI9573602.1 nucleoside recognition domain-containing protein [Bacteroidota bacterium]OQC61967.1 MAG: Spore maturation protein B [Bacteroidetes bacterium ADurb.Bin012]MBP9511068.1 spore maturation protein [Bacteroidales bacterium]MBP9588123.1 spore maturation protein [Bacteroidales bacterium]